MRLPLGVALVGLGRAGRARLAAVEARPDLELRARIERGGDLTSALADPSIAAVLICTPNTLHPAAVERALEAGRHVCVEYPLAGSAARARALFALARSRERVLHVEHIELLSPTQEQLRTQVRPRGQACGGSLEFSGGYEGWIAQPQLAGSPALLALARLHRLLDLFGPARIESASLQRRPAGYRLETALRFERGGYTRLIEERGTGLPRALRWRIECARGRLGDPDPAPAQGLFARDLEHFVSRIRHGAPPYVSEQRIAHALELVADIDRLAELGTAKMNAQRTCDAVSRDPGERSW